ncbi:multidrug resistance protein MDR [Gigaspora margarita]|uniref:Multidrug resistance protein MDR n=1 Tax=Gigaspora margarita TaxID=4874 RepID=A0A8H4EJC4_GIGMA|nr:multidrug resistance protein MDR [Gigaspora margarita]
MPEYMNGSSHSDASTTITFVDEEDSTKFDPAIKQILSAQVHIAKTGRSYVQLFRFATKCELAIYVYRNDICRCCRFCDARKEDSKKSLLDGIFLGVTSMVNYFIYALAFCPYSIKNVLFIYPSRPDVKILDNISLNIEPGTTVALVGASGSGKSTIVSLLLRFYNMISGEILLDDKDISSLNLVWLRRQIGLVGQEPDLFNTSVAGNVVAYGLIGSVYEILMKQKNVK